MCDATFTDCGAGGFSQTAGNPGYLLLFFKYEIVMQKKAFVRPSVSPRRIFILLQPGFAQGVNKAFFVRPLETGITVRSQLYPLK